MTTDNQSVDSQPTSNAPPLETVRKVYAKDLRDKDPVHTVFRVTHKNRVTARSGKVFLAVGLGDRSGEVDARIFDQVDTLEPAFSAGDHVLVRGHVILFHGKTQIVVEALEKLDPGPLDPKEFELPPAPPAPPAPVQHEEPAAAPKQPAAAPASGGSEAHGARAVGLIREIVTERVNDPHVKALLLAFLDDPQIAAALPHATAAKGIHHAWRGGLAEHLLSVMRLTLRVADHYPMADRDLLLAGALLHDIMKVVEISSSDKGFEYTDEGRLVGHLVMTAQKIREKTLALPDFPPLLEQHLTHIVISHHGALEYGSPKLPMTLEAQLVHALDALDSRMASWLEAMARDPNERWTDHLKLYDRSLWKAPAPTTRGRPPVETRRKKAKRDKPDKAERHERKAAKADRGEQRAAPSPAPASGAEPAAPRKEKPPKPPRDPVSVPKELTFKPFSVLTATPKSSESAEGSAPQPTPEPSDSEG